MTKHRGAEVGAAQWWKHLRDWKREFWKRDRKASTLEHKIAMQQAMEGRLK